MDWDDLDHVLYDGTKEEILKVRCPDCGGKISFQYFEREGLKSSFTIKCSGCYTLSKGCGGPKPNCAEFFGNEYTIA
jgi:ribosomal protein S27E